MVPRTVAIPVLTKARMKVFFAAWSLSSLSKSEGYHSVVKPRHGPP
jgi:hypothetical protein